jgi:hypothetical protein
MVLVRYPADRPDWATALPPGQPGVVAGVVLTLLFLAVFLGICVFFAFTYMDLSMGAEEAFPPGP